MSLPETTYAPVHQSLTCKRGTYYGESGSFAEAVSMADQDIIGVVCIEIPAGKLSGVVSDCSEQVAQAWWNQNKHRFVADDDFDLLPRFIVENCGDAEDAKSNGEIHDSSFEEERTRNRVMGWM